MKDIITLDWETYYDDKYSLSKLTTEAYVRDRRFEVIGLGIKYNDQKEHWFTDDNITKALGAVPWDKVAVLCHNTAFDGLILNHHYDINPAFLMDTLSMARPWHAHNVGLSLAALAKEYELGEKGTEVINAKGKRRSDFTAEELEAYGLYCKNDCSLTWRLFQKLKAKTPNLELLLIDRTLRMFCNPRLVLDIQTLNEHLQDVRAEHEALLEQVAKVAPKEVLMSNPQLAELLEALGVEDIPMKLSAKTKKPAYAFAKTDKAFTDLQEHENPLVGAVVTARLGVKSTIEETRAQRFLEIAGRGTLPVPLSYCGAGVTQRWAGFDKINMQNLTRDGKLREAVRAPEGMMVCSVDSSQIELRVNHTISGQEDTVVALRGGRDLYCEFSSELYNTTITKENEAERFLGKLAHLSLGYNCGWEKFKHICRLKKVILDDKDAQKVVDTWRMMYPALPKFWRHCNNALEDIATGKSRELDDFGLVVIDYEKLLTKPNNQILYPGLTTGEDGKWYYKGRRNEWKVIYGGKVVENICQHLARNIVAEQALIISTRYHVVSLEHDCVKYLAPEAEAEEATAWGVKVMSTPPKWWPQIPVAAEGKYGVSFK
jgi:DNA polymerase I-like protein with 3'-5' exonuclease and polymerase domains